MRATKTILTLVVTGTNMDGKTGAAAAYHLPSDDELIERAVVNLLKVFSPKTLYRFSSMVAGRQKLGFGEIRLLWARGNLDTICNTDSFKPNQLETEDGIYNN